MPEVGLGTAARLPKGPGENDGKGFQGRGRGGGGRRGGRGAINVGAGPVAQVQTFEDLRHHYFFIDIQGGFFNWSALKMTKYKEKLKYLNWSANCSSQKVLSVKPQ